MVSVSAAAALGTASAKSAIPPLIHWVISGPPCLLLFHNTQQSPFAKAIGCWHLQGFADGFGGWSADQALSGDANQMADTTPGDSGGDAARLTVDHHEVGALACNQIAPVH